MNHVKRVVRRLVGAPNSKQNTSEVIASVSFPKSGKTWLALMLAYISADLSGCDIRDFLSKHPKTYRHKITAKALPFVTFSHGHNNHLICKGNYFPTEFYQNMRLVLLVRDPRDVVISSYYYQKYHHEKFHGTLTEFIHYPYQSADDNFSRYGIAPIINYMNAWIENRSQIKDLYIIRYEDMRADAESHFASLLSYLGFDVSPDLLSRTLQYGSFENMRRLEESNELDWYALGGAKSQQGYKTRKGQVGAYEEEVSPEDLDYINTYIQAHLHDYYAPYKR